MYQQPPANASLRSFWAIKITFHTTLRSNWWEQLFAFVQILSWKAFNSSYNCSQLAFCVSMSRCAITTDIPKYSRIYCRDVNFASRRTSTWRRNASEISGVSQRSLSYFGEWNNGMKTSFWKSMKSTSSSLHVWKSVIRSTSAWKLRLKCFSPSNHGLCSSWTESLS